MDVREAIGRAKQIFSELFSEEAITEIGLEEVEYDEALAAWRITIGFARVRAPLNRWYKVVSFEDTTGRFMSLRNRDLALS